MDNCIECGIEFQCGIDNPDRLCDDCWKEKYETDE